MRRNLVIGLLILAFLLLAAACSSGSKVESHTRPDWNWLNRVSSAPPWLNSIWRLSSILTSPRPMTIAAWRGRSLAISI